MQRYVFPAMAAFHGLAIGHGLQHFLPETFPRGFFSGCEIEGSSCFSDQNVSSLLHKAASDEFRGSAPGNIAFVLPEDDNRAFAGLPERNVADFMEKAQQQRRLAPAASGTGYVFGVIFLVR